MKESLPFGRCVYDRAIADSVRLKISTREIADRFVVDAAIVRVRARVLGIPLHRTDRVAWHAQAEALIEQGLTYRQIATKVRHSPSTVRAYLAEVGIVSVKAMARNPPKTSEVEIVTEPEGFWNLPSDLPWPESVLRMPIRMPREMRVPCRLVQNGKIVRRFKDIHGALRAQKSLPGASEVVRKCDGEIMSKKTVKQRTGRPVSIHCTFAKM